jgi:hypothetical protein
MQKFALGAALLLVLALIAGLLASALGWWPGGDDGPGIEVSAEAAAQAEAKLETLEAGEQIALSPAELTSLFTYRPEVWSLRPVHSPVVAMSGDTVRVEGRVPRTEIPADIEMGPLRALLPDTTRVEVIGTVRSQREGTIALEIGSVEVEGMPVPARYYSQLLESDVLTLPLPAGVSGARVENGELILIP